MSDDLQKFIPKGRTVSYCWGTEVNHRKHLIFPQGGNTELVPSCWCKMFHIGDESLQSACQRSYLVHKYGSEEAAKYAAEIKNTHGLWPKQVVVPNTPPPMSAADIKAAVEQLKQASAKPVPVQEITFIAHPKTIDDLVDEIAKEMSYKTGPYPDFPENVELGPGIKIVQTGNGMFRVEADLKEVLKAVAVAVNSDKKDRKFR